MVKVCLSLRTPRLCDQVILIFLDKGLRTSGIMSEGCEEVGTAVMGNAVVEALKA